MLILLVGYAVTEQDDATSGSISELLNEMLSIGTLGNPSPVTSRTLNVNRGMTGALGHAVMPLQMSSCLRLGPITFRRLAF